MKSIVLLLVILSTVNAFNCPDNRQCFCIDEPGDEHHIQCATSNGTTIQGFDITIQRRATIRRLNIECLSNPNWTDFLMGSSIDVGPMSTLVFTGCTPPGPEHSKRVAELLGISGVELLKYVILNGTISREDLQVYPDVKTLVLNNNDMSNINADILQDLPQLRQLELRATNIRPPLGLFDNTTALRVLELGSNQLRQLPIGIFDGLDKLELLNLWKNEFHKLEPELFRGMKSLISLDINQNFLRTLPADIFKDQENLEVINLSTNNFTSLPRNLFRTTRKLRAVKLMYNKQNLTELPAGFFANLTNLKTVMITRNGLLRLPEDLFWGATNLRNLTIDRNYLQTLPQKIFRDTKELYQLSLSFNDIKELPDNIFENATKLTRLDLSKNHLATINDRMLIGLDSLRFLNLENNDLQYIHVDAFRSLGNLKVAKFANNLLTLRTGLYDIFGHISPFQHCYSLEELYLAHNNVTEMHSDWVVSNTKLRRLDLKYNSFNYLQSEDLQFISSSVSVDLRHNNISRVILARLESMAINQSAPRNVIIDIADNPIRCDCEVYDFLRYLNGDMHPYVQNYVHIKPGNLSCDSPDYMRDLQVFDLRAKSLKCLVESEQARPGDPCSPGSDTCTCWLRPEDRALLLDCARRNLTRAPEWIDAKAVAKVELDLRSNQLEEPPSMYKKGYEKVTSLNLSKNRIKFIDERLLSSNLKTLLLDGNNLTTIDAKILERLSNSSHISKLTLHDNPWSCECSSRDLLTFVHSNFLDIPDLLDITCAGTNISLSNVTIDELCPNSNALIIVICSVAAVFGMFVGLAFGLYYKYQRQIKIWLYSKNWCLCLVTEDEIDRDKTYDAFISFSHKDEEFVVKELVARLEEGPKPYKLCIHIRDWLAGEWIPMQIARSVDESRRTIIVLSPNFIESVWARLEFQAAHKQALSEKRARVIVVVYGEIGPTDDLDPELKAYLQTNTYVKWGDPWFWQKLRYAMPHSVKLPSDKKKNENLTIVSKQIADQKKNGEPRVTFMDEKQKNNGIIETVKGINKNFNAIEIRAPQCTTV